MTTSVGAPIYVDELMPTLRNRNWRHDQGCHLFCDVGNLNALHYFAAGMGLKLCWFQNKPGSMPHYDLTAGKRWQAVRRGAAELDREGTVKRIREWREFKRREAA